jgi:hypothetical protein
LLEVIKRFEVLGVGGRLEAVTLSFVRQDVTVHVIREKNADN